MTIEAKKWFALALLGGVTLIASMGQFITAPLAPFLIQDLGLNKTQLGILGTAVFWGLLATALLSGWATDRFGEKKMILGGVGLIAFALLGFSASPFFTSLLCFSFFIGAGYSTITPLTNKGIANWFPPQQQAFAIGLKQSGMPLGTALTAAFLPSYVLTTSWQEGTRLVAFLVLIAAFAGALCYPQPPLSIKVPSKQATSEGFHLKSLLRWKILVTTLLGMGFCMFQIALTTFLIPYFQETLFFSEVKAGYFLALTQGSGVVSRPLFGFLSDRAFKGEHRRTLLLLALLTVAFGVTLSLESRAWGGPTLALIVLGAGFSALGWFAPYFALLTEIIGQEHAGVASGLGATINALGLSAGGPLFGLIVDRTGSYRLAYQVFAGWLIFAAIFFFFTAAKEEKPLALAQKTGKEGKVIGKGKGKICP